MPKALTQPRIGISGWRYAPWRGTFYPKELPQKRELDYASSRLNSLEINGTFYSLQSPSSFDAWYAQTPSDFVFAVKGGQFITHMKRLKDVEQPLAKFFASGVLLLKEKLGPILWQFPPNFQCDLDRFETFFELLPRTTHGAARLAATEDSQWKKQVVKRIGADRPMRYAVEIRHESFRVPAFVRLLRKHSIALVIADTAGKWPYMEDITADFIYARLHGAEEIYASGYTEAALTRWAQRFKTWERGGEPADAQRVGPKARKRAKRQLFVYFDNDIKVRAPYDAMELARKLATMSEPEGRGR